REDSTSWRLVDNPERRGGLDLAGAETAAVVPVYVPGVELVGEVLEEFEPTALATGDEDVAPGRAIQHPSQRAIGVDEHLQVVVAQHSTVALPAHLDRCRRRELILAERRQSVARCFHQAWLPVDVEHLPARMRSGVQDRDPGPAGSLGVT